MGITQLSLDRINRHITKPGKLLILGCQNLYNMEHYGQIAHPYFQNLGYKVRSIDILGCQGSVIADLRSDLKFRPEFDYIFQHGTVEHVDGSLYQPFKNIHDACKPGGLMIHENPKTGNWPKHGYHYFTEGFYTVLAKACGYEILELTSEASMGNDVDGWNVSCVMRKGEGEFISEEQFNKIYQKHIKSE